jgi:hypothetical protein
MGIANRSPNRASVLFALRKSPFDAQIMRQEAACGSQSQARPTPKTGRQSLLSFSLRKLVGLFS